MEIKQLGDYSIIKQIGRGPLGNVFLAEHRLMKKQMILKVLPEELSQDRSFVQRIEEDLSVLSTLEHPNLVKIFNISFDQGRYFIVSDCIVDEVGETTNLGQMMAARGKRLPENDLVALLMQIAQALDYAHQKKLGEGPLFHGNLKLNNLLVGKGDNPTILISDFGLSRVIGVGGVLMRTFKGIAEAHGLKSTFHGEQEKYPTASDLTKIPALHHAFLQNYAFFAPEQKKFDGPSTVGYKADVYAFGILAYYLISGQYPEGVYTPPSMIAKEYRYLWDRLIEQCLQQDPQRRPERLVKAMENLTKKESVQEKVAAFQNMSSISSTEKAPENDHTPKTEMVFIQGGKFWRGSNDGNRDERPRHQVVVNSFALDIHAVTNEQFVYFLEMMGGEKDPNHNDIIRLKESRIKRSGGKISIESGYAKHPVVGVTWYGALAYARWIGKRLPYETEWEIASSEGEENRIYPTGDDIEKSQANFFSSDTTPVMSYAPNSWGLYDIAGNVYEWCQDWYSYNYYEISNQEPDNPHGPLQGVYRVLRGGCWKSLKEDLNCSRRHRNNPGTVNGTYGFRCAADVE